MAELFFGEKHWAPKSTEVMEKTFLSIEKMMNYNDYFSDGDDEYEDERCEDNDIYIMVKCLSCFCLFHFLPFLGTFGFRNKRKSV